MQTMHISSGSVEEFAEAKPAGRYSSVSEYVRDLIRDNEKRKVQERREALLMEGIHC